jgi:hypothetical protein
MAVGRSGRIVLEVDPGLKAELYGALEHEGITLKEWFLRCANSYLASQAQPGLFKTDTNNTYGTF